MAKDSLTNFANTVYAKAMKEKEEIAKALDDERISVLKEKDEELLKKFKNESKKSSSDIKAEVSRTLSNRETELTKLIRDKRQSIFNEVFLSAEKKLIDFSKSDEYKSYLINQFEGSENIFNDALTLCYLKECDFELVKGICPIVDIEYIAVSDEIIGGFILKNTEKGLYVDCTLKTRLDDEKQTFFKTSGLVIE